MFSPMKLRFMTMTGLLLVAAVTSAQVSSVRGGASSQCLGPDEGSAALINWDKALITSTIPNLAALRDSAGLGGVDTSSVVLVTDPTTCASAASAVDKIMGVRSSGRLVYVVQAGTQRFTVKDPNLASGEHITVWVFDTRFRLVRAILQ